MMREKIITALQERGYRVEAYTTVKNGVEKEGICFLTDTNVRPVIYTEEIIRMAERGIRTFDETIDGIIGLYESQKTARIDLDTVFEKGFILRNIYIGLQKDGTEDIVKRPCGFEGIESYLYITCWIGEEEVEMKISDRILRRAGLSKAEAWERAQANTDADTKISTFAELLNDVLGLGCGDELEQIDGMPVLYVISNRKRRKGASAILNKKALAEFGRKYHLDKVVVLPSSIHEMILFRYTDKVDLESFSDMVGIVNCTEVAPEERLTDRAYVIAV